MEGKTMYKRLLQLLFILAPALSLASQESTPNICSRDVSICCGCDHLRTFGEHWSVCEKLYSYIRETLKEGSTMLELGSGWASEEFSKHYTVWSIEHDEE